MENIMLGFANVFQLSNLLVCIGGLFVGVLFGALPGFSATMAVAIMVMIILIYVVQNHLIHGLILKDRRKEA